MLAPIQSPVPWIPVVVRWPLSDAPQNLVPLQRKNQKTRGRNKGQWQCATSRHDSRCPWRVCSSQMKGLMSLENGHTTMTAVL